MSLLNLLIKGMVNFGGLFKVLAKWLNEIATAIAAFMASPTIFELAAIVLPLMESLKFPGAIIALAHVSNRHQWAKLPTAILAAIFGGCAFLDWTVGLHDPGKFLRQNPGALFWATLLAFASVACAFHCGIRHLGDKGRGSTTAGNSPSKPTLGTTIFLPSPERAISLGALLPARGQSSNRATPEPIHDGYWIALAVIFAAAVFPLGMITAKQFEFAGISVFGHGHNMAALSGFLALTAASALLAFAIIRRRGSYLTGVEIACYWFGCALALGMSAYAVFSGTSRPDAEAGRAAALTMVVLGAGIFTYRRRDVTPPEIVLYWLVVSAAACIVFIQTAVINRWNWLGTSYFDVNGLLLGTTFAWVLAFAAWHRSKQMTFFQFVIYWPALSWLSLFTLSETLKALRYTPAPWIFFGAAALFTLWGIGLLLQIRTHRAIAATAA